MMLIESTLMKLTPGKLAGMKAVSDARGVIAAAAMDQRGSLKKALAKEKGGEISDAMMEEFKGLVTEVLTQHASAILLDPEWGIPASKRRAKGSGLLMAYEKTGYDANTSGRLPDLLDVDARSAQVDTLYRCHDLLLEHKEALFSHLRERWADLFGARYEVLLYDLTSTYFEGEIEQNPKARRGYSRDGRPDCVQLVIATMSRLEKLFEISMTRCEKVARIKVNTRFRSSGVICCASCN